MPGQSNTQLLSNPFIDMIMITEYPTHLRLPNIKTYLGRTDPESHINAYYGSMMMMGLSHAVICRALFSTLGGKVVDWFRTLESWSIKNFHQLSGAFVRIFLFYRTQRRHFKHFKTLRQNKGKLIALYHDRWTYEFKEVEHVDDRIAINTFHNSLKQEKCTCHSSPTSYPLIKRS